MPFLASVGTVVELLSFGLMIGIVLIWVHVTELAMKLRNEDCTQRQKQSASNIGFWSLFS